MRFDDGVRDALLEAVYGAGSDLLLLPFQDAFGMRERVNVPGTVTDENWTYRTPADLATLSADLASRDRLARLMERVVIGDRRAQASWLRERFDGVVLRPVERGHPLFGPACELIRAEALVPLAGTTSQTSGLLALGQRRGQGFETRQGSELLLFLGSVLMISVDRWLTP